MSKANEEVDQTGFAVYPLSECRHCAQIGTPPAAGLDLNAPCAVCQNVGENMVCMTCFEVHCGRHVKAHMLDHHEKTSHPMVCGFADLTVWCYPCENYVVGHNTQVKPIHSQLYTAKFGEEDPCGAPVEKHQDQAPVQKKGDQQEDAGAETKQPKTDGADPLVALRESMDKTTMSILPVTMSHYSSGESRRLVNYTCLFKGAMGMTKPKEGVPVQWQNVVLEQARSNQLSNRAMGCMMGMTIGDSVGAPMEFLPVDSSLPPYKQKMTRNDTGRVSFLDPTKLDGHGNLIYVEEFNKFRLNRGQWTDDSSMGFAMAESLLVNGHFDGADMRVRFYSWWYFGYCNAFRNDPDQTRTSVGLGGNISKSLDDLMRFKNKTAKSVPAAYESEGEDAGNGSIMRLAAIPIRYQFDEEVAMSTAELSSYTTHPGPDAAVCCRFLTYFCIRAMKRADNSTDVNGFLDATIKSFIESESATRPKQCQTPAVQKLFALLQSQPPSPKEQCWDWKADRLGLEETLQARGRKYNGYPVMAGYFGSYCMDGLAMALWSLSHSTNFADCIFRIVNLLGDCDTTGAIAGQMAGAFYGYDDGMFQGGPFAARMLANVRRWDPVCEVELRALLLLQDGVAQGDMQLD